MFPLHHVHERNSQESNLLPPGLQPGAHPHELEFLASRREESNLRRVVPNHACFRYTTSSRRDVFRFDVASVAWHHCAVVKEQ